MAGRMDDMPDNQVQNENNDNPIEEQPFIKNLREISHEIDKISQICRSVGNFNRKENNHLLINNFFELIY
jgi:hypothetical protein